EQGAVEVVSGAASVGQGMETVLAQICADALGVDYRKVRVVHGQTNRIERGMGAFASRVTVMTGEATRIAATALRTKAIEAAAELLQAPAALLDVIDGEVVRTDAAAGPSIGLGAIARALAPALAAAIDDALGAPNAVTELPITPLRLKRLIRQAGRGERLGAKPRPLDRPDEAR